LNIIPWIIGQYIIRIVHWDTFTDRNLWFKGLLSNIRHAFLVNLPLARSFGVKVQWLQLVRAP
jgi:hypothetical protein